MSTNLIKTANMLFRNKMYSEALKSYTQAINVFPELSNTLELNVKMCKNKILAATSEPVLGYTPFVCKEIIVDKDLSRFYTRPKHLPKDITFDYINGLGNDYSHLLNLASSEITKVSIVVLTYNRIDPLRKTLAGILLQTYPLTLIEVIVTDDGGNEDVLSVVREFSKLLDIKYVWHRDVGFTPAAARNNGVGIARNDFIILLDVDMYPSRDLVANYVKHSHIVDRSVLIGPRKYVDMNNILYSEILSHPEFEASLVEVRTNNAVADKSVGAISVDWRLDVFKNTDNLKNEKVPFRVFASGNVAFSKAKFNEVGKFNELFNTWGGEDTELGFRFFNAGLYMIPILSALAYHQEPIGLNETDRASGKEISNQVFGDLCPYYRHLTQKKADFSVPKVSIYIPTYNAENTICDAIDSVLRQTFRDIEVCICDDGSTDGTLAKLERYYGGNSKVRWVSQSNGGIGAASNAAVRLCRGIYIGQLDSDDYLADDVVEKCVAQMDKDLRIGLVYTSYENEQPDGTITPGYNYPVFTREKLITAMIAHHFRMFRKLYWHRTSGFNERIKNAVDYDMYLKIAEVCNAVHINVIGYRRRLHGGNTSIVNYGDQMKNTAVVVNNSLTRIGSKYKAVLESVDSPKIIYETI